jgi:tetratricopeptide (TPR) repeat protein
MIYWFMQSRNTRACYLNAGQYTLEMMERTPIITRFLTMEYARARDFEQDEGAANQLAEGIRLAKQLEIFEPHSAEVCLMAAELLGNSNKYEDAMKQALSAIRLDPSFPDAYAMLGHYQFQLVMARDPRSRQLIFEAIDNFNEALKRGTQLRPDHRMEYAYALFLVGSTSPGASGRTAAGIEQGRLLWGTPVYKDLLKYIRGIYKFRKEPEKGEQLIKQLEVGMPKPAAPAPRPATAPPKPANQNTGASATTGNTPWSP